MREKTTMRGNVMSLPCLAAGILVSMACLQPVYAEDYSWRTAQNGNFLDSDNWSPTGFPADDQDTAIFGVSGEYEVDFVASWSDPTIVNKRLEVSAGTVKFDLVYNILGEKIEVAYVLEPPSGWLTTAAKIGTTAGPQARLVVAGGDAFDSGCVEARGALLIGYAPGSSGRLDIGDPEWLGLGRGNWVSTYPTWVGMNGAGTLLVNEGEIVDGGGVIGVSDGVIGIATVDGSGDWTNHGSLTVGQSGLGLLNIEGYVVTDEDGYIARGTGSTGNVTLDVGEWTVGGNLYVGGDDEGAGGNGNLNVNGYSDVTVTGETTAWSSGNVSLTGDYAELDCEGGLSIQGGTIEIDGGKLTVLDHISASPGCEINLLSGAFEVESFAGFNGNVFNWMAGEVIVTSDGLNIDDDQDLGGNLQIGAGKSLSVANDLRVGPTYNGTLTVDAGGIVESGLAFVGSVSGDAIAGSAALTGAGSSWTVSDDLRVRGVNDAQLSLADGAALSSGDAYLADRDGTSATATLVDAGTQWDVGGALFAGGDEQGPRGAGSLEVDSGAALDVAGTVKVFSDFVIEIDGGSMATHDLDIEGEVWVLGDGTLSVQDGTIDIESGGTLNGVIVGDSLMTVELHGAYANWTTPGSITVGTSTSGPGRVGGLVLQPGAHVTVDETVTVEAISRMSLAGGTIDAAAIDLSDADFNDFGELNGEFSTTGSVTAAGTLTLGDINSYSGVQIGGALTVGPHDVTINKQGLYFVGDSTSIAGGTLTAPNGIGLTAPDYLLGFGVIDTPDDATKPLTNDGAILGNSASERFEITGYVEGLGMLDYVTISGTDNLGSVGPAGADRGSVDYAGQLVIEIGGSIPGAEHDQINHSGTVGFGGELTVELLAGFEPDLGDSFTIMTYTSHTGQFDTLSLPALATGLEWQVDYGPSSLTLEVVTGGQIVGDCDLDGDVDLSDLAQLLASYGTPDGATWGDGDFDDDGDVDLSDLAALLANYGIGL